MPLEDHALVVGINTYPAIGCLKGAEADAQDFFDWVTDPAGGNVKLENAQLIQSKPGPTNTWFDAEPSKSTIESFFRRIDDLANLNNTNGEGLAAGRRIYLFFSGHGFAPAFDRSALLVANSSKSVPDHFASPLMADRLFQGAWFEEVLLFQDACREQFSAVDLMPPVLVKRGPPTGKARFYAMAAHDGKLSLEKPDAKGQVRGVFTLTLMEALRGRARDPVTGAITNEGLKSYLQNNMRAKYSPEELQDETIAQMPDVRDPDPLVIVAPPSGGPVAETFPVRVTLPAAFVAAAIKDNAFRVVDNHVGSEVWNLVLPLGYYKVSAGGGFEEMFEVTGATDANGTKVVVNVPK